MRPVHPGKILKDEIEARGLSANALALALRTPSGRVTDGMRSGCRINVAFPARRTSIAALIGSAGTQVVIRSAALVFESLFDYWLLMVSAVLSTISGVYSELSCPVLVARRLSASSAFVLARGRGGQAGGLSMPSTAFRR